MSENKSISEMTIGELGQWMKDESKGFVTVKVGIEVWNCIADKLIDTHKGILDLIETLAGGGDDGE